MFIQKLFINNSTQKQSITAFKKIICTSIILLVSSIGYSQDSLRLVNFYNSTNGQNWINSDNWLSDQPISEWYGVTMQDSNITEIELIRNHLSGHLPEDIGEFTFLELINLSDNDISGELPNTLENLTKLQTLNLSHNRFSGNPVNLFDTLSGLRLSNLSNNNFSGTIPKNISKANKLEILNLSNNNFQNAIPNELFRLPQLTELNLQSNNLSGSIPRQVGNCINLHILDLSRNNLSGSIPKEIGKLTNLTERLALDHNDISGLIPKEFRLLINLKHLWLNNNQLSGILPFEFGKMQKLQSLFIYQNNLVGPLPPTLGYLRDLELFYAQNNSFGGSVPDELWFLPKLKMLRLENNQLSGKIPGNLKILGSIQTIDLSNNHFNEISDSLSLPKSMLSLNLTGNNLFCKNNTKGEVDSISLKFGQDLVQRITGIELQNCNENTWSSFIVKTKSIDFNDVKTDSTAETSIWITNNNSRTNMLSLSHFDQDNFYISDSLINLSEDDTIHISLSYFPINDDTHYDVLIINDIINKRDEFVTIVGGGIDISLPDRDTSIPWKLKLHPISISDKDNTIEINYDIPEQSKVNIAIYNLGGRPVKTVIDSIAEAGFHNFVWDGADNSGTMVEGGEYLCVMQSGMFIQIQPMLLLF